MNVPTYYCTCDRVLRGNGAKASHARMHAARDGVHRFVSHAAWQASHTLNQAVSYVYDGHVPLEWAVLAGTGDDPVAAAWAACSDPGTMRHTLDLLAHPKRYDAALASTGQIFAFARDLFCPDGQRAMMAAASDPGHLSLAHGFRDCRACCAAARTYVPTLTVADVLRAIEGRRRTV